MSLSRPHCREAARFVGYRPKGLLSLLGPVRPARAYYHCEHCHQGRCPGDAVMGLYFAPLSSDGRYVDSMVSDAHAILRTRGYGTPGGPQLEVGIGLDVGPAYVGIVGEGEIRDFTAIGDVVNTASRLQGVATGGEIVMSEAVARIASVDGGEVVMLDLKGKAEPVAARRITIAG